MALILVPTRELASQIDTSLKTYGRYLKFRRAVVYGGVSQYHQVRDLDRGPHLLVATPGRLLDLIEQGYVSLEDVQTFVLDEADRMLDMGFMPDLKRIVECLPRQRQSLFFSATFPEKIARWANKLLDRPVKVRVSPRNQSVKHIDQRIWFVEKSQKQRSLTQILADDEVTRAIVFTRTKRGANNLAEKLKRKGIDSAAIHGNKTQNAREKTLLAFRRNRIRVLVATDVASRGIDVEGISHVVNYDLPDEAENYVHRIGRTGRAGAEGIAISFCGRHERRELREIERLIGHSIECEKPFLEESDSRDEATERPMNSNRNRRNQRRSGQTRRKKSNDTSPMNTRSKRTPRVSRKSARPRRRAAASR